MSATTTPEARVVVVDDEPSLRDLLVASLRFAGFDVATASSGHDALEVIAQVEPDLVVLDVMLGDIDGFEVTRRLRERGIRVPVLFLTARDDVASTVAGLTVGGDDYVTKPFSLEELVARIRAVLRRTHETDDDSAVLRYADLEIDSDAREVRRGGRLIELSPTEFELLRYLTANAGRVLSRAQILDHVWDYDWRGEPTIVESYISYLRRKVDAADPASPDGGAPVPLIHTRRGLGYVLKTP
ncbi:response regulator transcription factor [Serinibacter arcticus]|uniref:Phosphate regulon transcriptional regulatory protein PhoB (SphR) n=1 Tax=Serinibacter arcticus TaxID=1655435 RepID=A0A4Z1E4T1_9MICO|nr:response regulator transcription factor [Serinibacter arcticus]TGO05782.1 Phosphate regulon transcriptional regulatory protein PhoB (SphR) [Serinibacter arcticus]